MAAPDGTFHHLDAGTLSMAAGVAPTLHAGLMNVPETALPELSLETAGSYTFFFGVDTHMDAMIDAVIYYDSVGITINEPSG